TYNSNVNVEDCKNFEYYIVSIYSENYNELVNKLSQIYDKKAVYNLIYSAKLPTLSAVRKIFDSHSSFEFLTKLAYRLKYGKYNATSLNEKHNSENMQRLNMFMIDSQDDIIYLNNMDISFFNLLLKCLRLLKPLCGEFTIFCKGEYTNQYRIIREQFWDIKVIFSKDIDICEHVKKIAFVVLNSEIVINVPVSKECKLTNCTSDIVEIPKITQQDRYGGFSDKKYILTRKTQKPFSNVITGEYGGFVASNNGENFTYFGNSRNDKVTEWRGEAYSKINAESLIITSENKQWQINKYLENGYVEYRQGYIKFVSNCNNLKTECIATILDRGMSKIYSVNITNLSEYQKNIKIDLILKIALGIDREKKNILVSTQNNITEIVNVKNNTKVYIKSIDSDLYSVIDDKFNTHNQTNFDIEANGTKNITIAISKDKELLKNYNKDNITTKYNETFSYFDNLNKVKIKTNNCELDMLFNNWLMYQTVSARLTGKCGYYQVGGAIGFRDQLQDCLSYLYTNPEYVKNHILLSAERQFIEGDILHWWHGYAEGVRTKISDDKLFLPYVVSEYINFTGDKEILKTQVPYLKSESIPANQKDLYKAFEKSDTIESLYSHCIKAFKNALKFGENELLLIGEGDWNDALNNIGNDEKGESVWLSMFFYYTLKCFDKFMASKDRQYFEKYMQKLQLGIENSWNGHWYNRAYTKNGEWLGNEDCVSCKIDLISQAFAVICGGCDKEKSKQALAFTDNLIDKDKRIVKLLSPPFNDKKNYGYISEYPEGVRENGGQYTHSVAWFIKALAKINIDKAVDVLNMINPINMSSYSPNYKNEPFVISADVYTTGEGGWSWYTGSSSWLYKVILNDILGINFEENKIIITPCRARSMQNYSIELKFNKYSAKIQINHNGKYNFMINNIKQNQQNEVYIINTTAEIKEYNVLIEY
ncbi:MAG: hypothetical protein K2P12_02860, partial [Clostridia bacterium]|nr:hypothetical protein [Clostridia bacterium]